jgi:hypothetical protein
MLTRQATPAVPHGAVPDILQSEGVMATNGTSRWALGPAAPARGRRVNERVASFPHGRVCAAADCDTILSTYNPSAYCAIHDVDPGSRPTRARRPSFACERHRCANLACGRWFKTSNAKRQYCSSRCRSQAFDERRRQSRQGATAPTLVASDGPGSLPARPIREERQR